MEQEKCQRNRLSGSEDRSCRHGPKPTHCIGNRDETPHLNWFNTDMDDLGTPLCDRDFKVSVTGIASRCGKDTETPTMHGAYAHHRGAPLYS